MKSRKQTMNNEMLITLLQELIYARGPGGQEDEVRDICKRELKKYADNVWIDAAGNVVGHVRARSGRKNNTKDTSAIRVMAHMDENAMIVKRIEPNGALRVQNLGALHPGYIGQGPVDILADLKILPGVLSLGPSHSSPETRQVEETKTKAIEWSHLHVFTNQSAEELKKTGVHPGTRVVIAKERRKLFDMGDCVGGYFMDDRAPIAIVLAAAKLLRAGKARPPYDIYFVMTTEEEIGAKGALYASRVLPGDMTIAIEIGPIADEYGTQFREDPIVAYGDTSGVYTKSLADRLVKQARALGMTPQTAVWHGFGSDASISKAHGQSALAALICIPTQNTHGFEIIPRKGIAKCAELLAAFLQAPANKP